jgi:SUKH-4 immunity protein
MESLQLAQLARVPIEEVVRLFGEDNIVRFPADSVAPLPVPSSARDILINIGVPGETDFFAAAEAPQAGPAGFTQIGTDYGTDICVDSAGRVHSISASGEYPNRFVNSHLEAFLRFLALALAERAASEGLPDDELDERVEVLADVLAGIDEAAFEDPENWWAVIFEQMRDGLL